jgi:hypothetical protein
MNRAMSSERPKMSYYENLVNVMKDTNKKALDYGDGTAWDNRKIKTWKQVAPRGKVFRRANRKETQRKMYEIQVAFNSVDEVIEKLIKGKGNTVD